MSRVQLALNVTDIDKAVDFYSKLFDAEPAKRKPGYANFAIADPPLKLVLFEGPEGATLNHLGVETETAEEVGAAEARLADTGLETTGVDDTVCCYATKVETWVTDPDGAKWEWYVKTGDADQLKNQILGEGETAMCCAPEAVADPVTLGRAPAPAESGCC
jgi:catechol 2,3-dioxygenase-like lactoylglutathione lyase family enzyme